MKTFFIKSIESLLKISGFLVILFLSIDLHAQVEPEDQESATDTIKGYNTGKILIKNLEI